MMWVHSDDKIECVMDRQPLLELKSHFALRAIIVIKFTKKTPKINGCQLE